ncbi:MAG TPA: benenodin family lasso peptide [Frateuria sp.]|nr:benenodin family lasso peptide [Frateuria sp.]
MNTNDNANRINAQEDVIELGVASVETKGIGAPVNETFGRLGELGISE